MPTTDSPKSKSKSLLILLVSWAVDIAALVALPVGEPPEIVSAAAASKAVIFQEEEQERQSILELRANPPTTTTTPPPTTTTTHYHPPTPKPQPQPQPASQPAPQAPAPTGSCGGWEGLISAHFPNEVPKACSVMMCESKGNPTAENSSSSASGLWQFLDGTWESVTGTPAPASQYSAETQTAAAAKLRNSSGWGQWSCS